MEARVARSGVGGRSSIGNLAHERAQFSEQPRDVYFWRTRSKPDSVAMLTQNYA